jgi:hypothetical protein
MVATTQVVYPSEKVVLRRCTIEICRTWLLVYVITEPGLLTSFMYRTSLTKCDDYSINSLQLKDSKRQARCHYLDKRVDRVSCYAGLSMKTLTRL